MKGKKTKKRSQAGGHGLKVKTIKGAQRLTMANAKETVKRKGWYHLPLLCLITSLL